MLQELINLTVPVVIQEIESVLEEYPEHPYQSAFAMPELRQKLIAHVLSHVPNHCVAEGEQELSSEPKVRTPSLLQERLRMEMVVRGGILHILRENADWLSRHLPNV
jgi:hypothetical protein